MLHRDAFNGEPPKPAGPMPPAGAMVPMAKSEERASR
jgi:hypothetical protein